jgi:hypothetical protein
MLLLCLGFIVLYGVFCACAEVSFKVSCGVLHSMVNLASCTMPQVVRICNLLPHVGMECSSKPSLEHGFINATPTALLQIVRADALDHE